MQKRVVLTIGIARGSLARAATKGAMSRKPKKLAEGTSPSGKLSFLVGPDLLKSMEKAAAKTSRLLYQDDKGLTWWIKRVLANALQTNDGLIDARTYPELNDDRAENIRIGVSSLFHDACVDAAAQSGCSLTDWILAHCLKAMDDLDSGVGLT